MRALKTFFTAMLVLLTSVLVSAPRVDANSFIDSLIDTGMKQMGTPYVFGGSTTSGFDCSGFVSYVFKQHNISLPRTSADMFNVGRSVPRDQLKRGDVVFFTTYKPGPSHAGIYLGDDKFIHASEPRVKINSLNETYYVQRYLGARSYISSEDLIDAQLKDTDQLAKALRPYFSGNVKTINDVMVSQEFEESFSLAREYRNELERLLDDVPNSRVAMENDIKAIDDRILNAARFIDGVKVGEQLLTAQRNLQVFIDTQVINQDTRKAYDDLSAEIRRGERVLSRIFGSEVRGLFFEKYITPAKITREVLMFEISRYDLLQQIETSLESGDFEKVAQQLETLYRLEVRSAEIKQNGNTIYPGRYPTLPLMEDYLQALSGKLNQAFVAATAIQE